MAQSVKYSNNSDRNTSAPEPAPRTGYSVKMLAIILAVISFLVYTNTIQNGYVLDDSSCIARNTIVSKGIAGIPQLLATPYHFGFQPTNNDLYRPIALVTFAIETQFLPGNTAIPHFINVLLFAACVVLLFLFLDRIFYKKKTATAFIASLLFALHPIHTEVVANIKSRDELLCFFFGFLSLLLFIKYTWSGNKKMLALGGLAFFFSLLSKETSISLLAVVPLVFIFFRNEERKRSFAIIAASIVVSVLYMFIRFSVLRAFHADHHADVPFIDNPLVHVPAPASRLATALLLMGMYIKLLIIPHPLICDYAYHSIPFVGFANIGVLISIICYALLLVIGVYRLVKKKNDGFAFAILFFLCTIALFSNIFFLPGAAFAERFVFFASAGFCLSVALLLEAWLKKENITSWAVLTNKKTLILMLLVGLIYIGLTISRNAEWKDNYTLYTADVQKAQDNSRLYWYRGNELTTTIFQQETGMQAKKDAMLSGIKDLQTSIAIYPDFTSAQQDLGYAFFMLQQYDSAEFHSLKALKNDPANIVILNTLAGAYFSEKKYDLAITYCKRAFVIAPDNPELARNIGFAYLQMKQYDSSIVYFSNLVRKFPDNTFCVQSLGEAYRGAGRIDSAVKYETVARSQRQSGQR